MRSQQDEQKPETAQPAPAIPQAHQGSAPAKPGLSLEERVARLEQRLVPIIGEL